MALSVSISLDKNTESQLLDALEIVTGDSSTEAHDKRVEILDELAKRPKMDDETRAFYTLTLAAKKHGLSKPEDHMLSESLRKLCQSSDALLISLMSELTDLPGDSQLLPCVAKTIRGFTLEKKKQTIGPLVDALVRQQSTSGVPDHLVDVLVSLNDAKLDAEAASRVSSYLTRANSTQVFLASRIVSRIGGKDQFEVMLTVLERRLNDWYGTQTQPIESEVVRYFARWPGERALPVLMRLMKTRPSFELAKALGGFSYEATALALTDLAEESTKDYRMHETLRWSMEALASLDPSLVDLKRLVTNPNLFETGTYSDARYYIMRIIQAAGQSARPLLFDMLKSQNKDQYRFATEALVKLECTTDEMARVFGESPSGSILRFFFPGDTPEKIWAEKNPERQGGDVKPGLKRFDLFLIGTLTALNFQVLHVDRYGTRGVDVVAFSPFTPHLIVAGGTIGPLKEDIRNLAATVGAMREGLPELTERFMVLPTIFTASQLVSPDELRFAAQEGIIVLGREDVERVLLMARTGRSSQDLIDFLSLKRDEMARLSPGQSP